MIDIKIDSSFRDVDKLFIEHLKSVITEKAGNLLCPDHQKIATVTITVKSAKNYTVNIHSCCDKFNATITERINRK